MVVTNQNMKIKCPTCGGQGMITRVSRDGGYPVTVKTGDLVEYRLSNLTGTDSQCNEAHSIRSLFINKAKKIYDADQFLIFIKLISYEAHAIFWINSREMKLSDLINRIAIKNPTALDLINEIA